MILVAKVRAKDLEKHFELFCSGLTSERFMRGKCDTQDADNNRNNNESKN